MNKEKELHLHEGDDCPYECYGHLVGDEDELLVCSECEESFYPEYKN